MRVDENAGEEDGLKMFQSYSKLDHSSLISNDI